MLYGITRVIEKYCWHKSEHLFKALSLLLVLLLPAVFSFSGPLQQPAAYAPTVQSPLLLLLKPIAENTDGIDNVALLKDIKINTYNPYLKRPVKQAFLPLRGIAKDYNIVFYVMESVRRRNLQMYGYHRQTMPTFTKLSENALVFDQAYVMQPRSSKAMSALALGVMPDPRLRPLSWHPQRIKGRDSFFKRVMAEGRRFYMGTAQPYGGDNLQRFFVATVDNQVDTIVSFDTLKADATLPNDDVGLSQHFVRWVKHQNQPFVGLLWTECAHMPYVTEQAPYGRHRLIDKYDNCLNQVDRGLAALVAGLKRANALDNTLLVVFGDHGEALGEKFDRGHGSYLYEHSMRIPFMLYNPGLFTNKAGDQC